MIALLLAAALAPIWHIDYQVMTPGGTDMAKTLPYKIGHGVFLTKKECDAAGKKGVPYYQAHMVPDLVMQPGWKVKYACTLKRPVIRTPAELEHIHGGH